MRVNYNICYVFSLSFKTLIPIKSVKLVRMHHLIELRLSKLWFVYST